MTGLLHTFSHAKRLRHLVPPVTALSLARDHSRRDLQRIYIKPLGRHVYIRPRTSDLACFEQVFVRGDYVSPYEINPATIIDAGANIGAATLFFAHHYPSARIFAIEPEATNFAMLKRNCGSLPDVTLIEAALWSKPAHLSVADAGEKFTAFVTEGAADGAAVEAVTVDGLMSAYGLDRIDLLKMDVEGAEKEIFTADTRWLDKVDVVAIELHDRFKAGCAQAFYFAIAARSFEQEIEERSSPSACSGQLLARRLSGANLISSIGQVVRVDRGVAGRNADERDHLAELENFWLASERVRLGT